jgi:hypothetical protein
MIHFRLPTPPARPLPVIATIRRAYELLWEHRRVELRLMLAPLVLLAVAMSLQTRIVGSAQTVQEIMAITEQTPPGLMFAWFATMGLGAALLISFSVSWRRFLLLRETPSAFYFHRPFWRYLGLTTVFYMGLLLALVMTALLIVFLLYLTGLHDHPLILRVVFTGTLIVALAVFVGWIVRHILLFTAITVDNRGLTWRDAAEAMQGNVIRYCLVWAGTIAPVLFISNIIAYALAFSGLDLLSLPGIIAFSLVQSLVSVLQIGLGSSLGALIYDFLLRGGGPKQD